MFSNFFKRFPKAPVSPAPAPIYAELRKHILTLIPGEVGIVQSEGLANVWGVLMECGFPQAVATLVSLADGTTSLYFGNGGGIIGSGEYTAVARASQALVAHAEDYLNTMSSALSFPLPLLGQVRFYILTFSGIFMAEADERELAGNNHRLSPLFYSAQDVITQIRLQDQRRERQNGQL